MADKRITITYDCAPCRAANSNSLSATTYKCSKHATRFYYNMAPLLMTLPMPWLLEAINKRGLDIATAERREAYLP